MPSAKKGSVIAPTMRHQKKSHTSYISRMGETQEAAAVETILVHDDAEYIGTL